MVAIVLRSLMWLYMLVLLAVWGCLYFVTRNSWWTTLFLVSPRWVLGLPWLLLFPLTLLVDYRIARWYAIHLIVLVIPLLGFCVPSFSFDERANEAVPRLRVMTCNLGEGPIRVGQLLLWLEQERSEVLLLQECNSQLLEELKQKLDWNFRRYDKLATAMKRAQCTDFVAKLPRGLETIVGERGAQLSGGQKQRIAIARALLKDAPLLIFDEATSALDNESERLIQHALEELFRERTVIIIAHRLSSIRFADRVVVLDEGKIAVEGQHPALLDTSDLYRTLTQLYEREAHKL